jgi:ribonuclease BN (tRNA processing enzyme)
MQNNRRDFLAGAASFVLLSSVLDGSAFKSAPAKASKTRLILLGTKGGPSIGKSGRSNYSTLLLINDVPYVVDCGYGVSRQLISAGVALERIRYIFITHHHSDHNLEYGSLFYNAWITGQPIDVDAYGPTGLQKLTHDFFEYQKFDIETRIVDEGRPDPRRMISVHEFSKPGVVMHNDAVKITSCLVHHPPITQSYAYRFDTADRSIVISGDTAYAPELAEFARGADVLVHEVMYLPAIEKLLTQLPDAKRLREHLMAAHTLPEDVGKIAAQAGVKTLVLSHFVPGDDPTITDDQWMEGARRFFKGPIVVGKDLLEIH